jgi:hypothetical protein
MEVLASESDWLPTDEENLARFLDTDTGKRLVPKLVAGMPSLLAGGETNAILIRCGEVRAYQTFMETLVILAHPPQASVISGKTEYPPLEHDAAWDDGQKLKAPEPLES